MQRLRALARHADAVLALGVIGLVLLLIVPLPPIFLDTLICFNIVFSVITLLLALYIEDVLEFSAFPSLLLFLTLYRLGLNIASTRMILTRSEAGDIIGTFGKFVAQNNFAVGIILFTLLTIINFIVVTKGAGRIAEVAARFTLEALPGKQMAIDSELSSGLLTHSEAKKERERISLETHFYGSMDGASKFVRGDAIASLIITVVNILGGLIVGIAYQSQGFKECFATISCLTIGDGLATQIPALLISVGAGIMVTRARQGSLTTLLTKQVLNHPKVLLTAASFTIFLSLIPGMPVSIIVPIGFTLFIYSLFQIRKRDKKPSQKDFRNFFVHPIEIQLGLSMVYLSQSISDKLDELKKRTLASIGVLPPTIHISDNLELPPSHWKILVKGATIKNGKEGDANLLLKNLAEVIEDHLYELMTRQHVLQMIQEAKSIDSAVIEELIPNKLAVGHLLKVLQNLLREKIPIRDFITILELLADHATGEKNPDIGELTEKVRMGLSKGISENFFGKLGKAHVITIDPKVEQLFMITNMKMRRKMLENFCEKLKKITEEAKNKGIHPVIVVENGSRANLRKVIENLFPSLPVLSYKEINHEIEMLKIGCITDDVLI